MPCKDRCSKMNEVLTKNCICGIDVFIHNDGEHQTKYEDFAGTIHHTKLRCEINQIISKHLGQLQIQINQIKERLNLE